MGREFNVGDEPVPGYRLVAMLGKGGFGTVWRAVGPGRTEVALKITDLLDSKRGMREFKSLRLMKRVRHPNLVPIVAIWLIDSAGVPLDDDSIDLLGSNVVDSEGRAGMGTATLQFNAARAERLIVGMGLGEKDLLDLLHEYQANGEPSIPIDRLLDYMDEAAKAIDFLNEPRHNLDESGKGSQLKSIHHCDIKPGNIMLVGGSAQVCDFGLARREDVRATSVALSCAYGAPELYWQNKATQGTDQYSLAVTYYELRTGELPFDQDSSQLEVMQLHRDGKLDFRRVGEAERAVLKRATNPKPEERYPSCKEMVASLRMAVRGSSDLFRYAIDPRQSGTDSQLRSTLVPGRQLVPGYRLGEHLFHADTRTDVWSATGPGGKHYSLWIYDLTSLSETIDVAALRILQEQVEHAHLARISGWWCLNAAGDDITAATAEKKETDAETAQLVIASEFSRTHLGHKAQERRELTDSGIPADELVDYMRQASGAIDALNAAVYGAEYASLLHTDIRPANFLLVGNSVKLANVAWCRRLVGDEAEFAGLDTRPPRITMAAEVLEGRLNRRSDQYSLAVSYVQLRSGKLQMESALPSATTQILAAPELDFSALSPEERTVIDRALSHDPRRRFANCQSMVEALEQVVARVRVPELVPAQKGSGEIDRGTAMPGMLAATATTEANLARHRETSPALGATTDPDMPAPVSPARARLKPLAAAAVVAVTAAMLFGIFVLNKQPGKEVTVITDTNGPQPTVPDATETAAGSEAEVAVSPAASPEEEFTQRLAAAEKQFNSGNVDDGEASLKQATALLDKLADPAAARQRLGLAEARLAIEQKQWSLAAQRLETIDAQQLTAAERTRFYLLRAFSLAEFNGGLADKVDLIALSKAIADVRRHVTGWQDASYRRDRLADKMTAVIRAAVERAADLSADPSSDAQSAARGVLAAFDPAEMGSFNREIQVSFALATVNARLSDPSSTWAEIEPAWQSCVAQATWLSRDDESRLAARLLDWSGSAAGGDALAKVLKAYDSLGDLPPSAQYAGMCIQLLEQIASTQPIDWTALGDKCEKTHKVALETSHPRLYFVQLCEAECALVERDARKRAGEALRKMPSRPALFSPPSDEAYFNYVAMRVEREDHRQHEPADVDRLCDALAQSPQLMASKLLAANERRASAAHMLIDAAQRLASAPEDSPLGTLSFSPPENADRAYRWLTQAKASSADGHDAGFAVLLAAASLDKTQREVPEALPPVPAEPLWQKRTVLSLRARAAEVGSNYADGVRAYAELLRALDMSSAQRDLAMVYSTVVKPALDLATKLEAGDLKSANADVGYLYAAKGRLLRFDAAVAFKVFEESLGQLFGPEAVFDAYQKAIEHDPSVADYYIQRGTARYNSTSAYNNLEALNRDDISPAGKLLAGRDSPGLASLTGVASLLEGRASDTRAKRLELYKKAEADERKAVEGCNPADEDYPQFLLLHSMACLELANWTTESQKAIERYLKDAVDSADKLVADGRGARPDLGYQALGNAQEDYGLLLRDYSGYRRAIDTFESWRLKASENPLSPPYEALICLGRTCYRLADSGAESATVSAGLFQKGLENLQTAIDLDGTPPKRAAEAYWWQAQIHAARMRRASQQRQLDEARVAAETAVAHALECAKKTSADWRTYQMFWANLAKTPDVLRSRAKPLLDPPVSKLYATQAVAAIAKSSVTAPAGASRRSQLDGGLDQFRSYMPWLPDTSKAQADDLTAVLALAEFLLRDDPADRKFWSDNRDLCQKLLERALALAADTESPDLLPRAHADMAKHLVFAAMQSSPPNIAGLRTAAEHLKKAVDVDDNLAGAALMAWERQRIHTQLAGEWRRDLAVLYSRIAANSQTPATTAKKLCQDALTVLDNGKDENGKDLPAYAQSFQQLRLTISKIQRQLP